MLRKLGKFFTGWKLLQCIIAELEFWTDWVLAVLNWQSWMFFLYSYIHKLDVSACVRHFPAIIVFVKTSFLLPDCLDTVMKEHKNKKRMPMYQTTTRVMRTNEERGDSSWEWHIQTYGAASDGWQKQQLGSSNWSHVWYQAHSSFSKCEDCFLSWFNLLSDSREESFATRTQANTELASGVFRCSASKFTRRTTCALLPVRCCEALRLCALKQSCRFTTECSCGLLCCIFMTTEAALIKKTKGSAIKCVVVRYATGAIRRGNYKVAF